MSPSHLFVNFHLQSQSNLRLRSGPKEGEGRLEMKRNGRWGAVCHRGGWDLQAASVACRQLGYGSAKSAARNSFYGQGIIQMFLLFGYLFNMASYLHFTSVFFDRPLYLFIRLCAIE